MADSKYAIPRETRAALQTVVKRLNVPVPPEGFRTIGMRQIAVSIFIDGHPYTLMLTRQD